MRVSCFLILYLIAFSISPGVTQSNDSPLNFVALEDSIKHILNETKAPGAQVALFTSDSMVWNKNFGLRDVADSLSVEYSTFFRIGSITKTFVSTAILQLVVQGKLNLKDKVSDYLDDVQYKNRYHEESPILIEHLLEHTAGFDDMHMKEYAARAEGWTLKQGMDYHPDNRYARWRPGTHMSYCNSGPPMAAYIVEKITGQHFDDYVRDHIFLPLGMNHSSLLHTEKVIQLLSKGYDAEGSKEEAYWHISQRPAGSINSNATEMSKFIRMLMNRGSLDSIHILSPASVERMERCETTLSGKTGEHQGYGLHNYTTNYKGMIYHGHNGGMMGFLAQASYHPESDYGFVILVNATNNAINRIARQIFQFIYNTIGAIYDNDEVALSREEEDLILGYYRSATSRNQMLRFPEAIAGITKVGKDAEGYFVRDQIGGQKSRAKATSSNTLLIENDNGLRTPMVFAKDGTSIFAQQVNWMTNLKKSSWLGSFSPLILTALALLTGLLMALYALIWLPLRGLKVWNRGRKPMRWSALLATLSLFTFGLFFTLANSGNILENLGNPSLYAVGIFVSSLLLPIFMLSFIWYRIKLRVEDESRFFRVYTALTALFFLIACYGLFYFDMIGLRTWAY